jgi:hypothetical protein
MVHSSKYSSIAVYERPPTIACTHCMLVKASWTDYCCLVWLGTSWYRHGARSLMQFPWTHRTSQNRANRPSPIAAYVEAQNNAYTLGAVLIGSSLYALSWSVFCNHSHRVCSVKPWSFKSLMLRLPNCVGLQTVSQATIHLPLTEASLPAHRNFWQNGVYLLPSPC